MKSLDDGNLTAEDCCLRGQMMRDRSRHEEAATWFQKALSLDPNHAKSYALLSLCWSTQEDSKAKAVDAAQRAVALEPEDAFFRCVLALGIANQAKEGQTTPLRKALDEANAAVELEPESSFSHAVKAHLLLRLKKYPEAELAAREALGLDTENTMATQTLSASLLLQHKDADNTSLVNYQLENNPEDAHAHVSAGWLALHQGRHKEANTHFAEALRLDASNENARLGLVESFRARNILYRTHLRFSYWMARFSEGKQTIIMIGGYFAYRGLRSVLASIHPLLGSILVGVWMVFVFWSHLARGIGGFFMIWDRYASLSLTRKEFWEGAIVGGMALLAPFLLGLSYFVGTKDLAGHIQLVAGASFLASIAWAAAFTNDHHLGRYLYWGLAGLSGACLTVALAGIYFNPFPEISILAAAGAILIGVAVSWIRGFRVWYA